MKTLTTPDVCCIEKITQQAPGVACIHVDQTGAAPFKPGQFNMLGVRGMGEAPISISGQDQDGLTIHTVREVGNITRTLLAMKPGDEITIRGPYGRPWPLGLAVGSDILFIAGGIGIAPIRSAIDFVYKNREKYKRATLLYGVRTPDDFIFDDDFDRWSSSDIQSQKIVDVIPPGSAWHGKTGVVTSLIKDAGISFDKAVSFICGPELMMRFVTKDLLRLKHSTENIYVSLERRMRCGSGQCGHCMIGEYYVCKDGPVFPYHQISTVSDVLL